MFLNNAREVETRREKDLCDDSFNAHMLCFGVVDAAFLTLVENFSWEICLAEVDLGQTARRLGQNLCCRRLRLVKGAAAPLKQRH